MLQKIFFFCSIFLFSGCLVTPSKPKHHHYHEKFYQKRLCQKLGGEMEVVLPDKTRIDCLTPVYAIEVDFAKKWAQSIGQALYYAKVTKKKPAIGLIVGKKDKRYLKRLELVASTKDIKIFIIQKVE